MSSSRSPTSTSSSSSSTCCCPASSALSIVSPTYLYCLTAHEAPDPPAATVGVDGGPVRRIRNAQAPGAQAWVGDVDARSVKATIDRIRAHDSVIATALGTGSTPLPARFGQTFASDDECLAMIS